MKRFLATLLALALLLPMSLICLSGAEYEPENELARLDDMREWMLSVACAQTGGCSYSRFFSPNTAPSAFGNRYIVRFSDTPTDAQVLSFLRENPYELLSDSSERVFSVMLQDVFAFEAACGEALLYCCADQTLQTFAVPSDPLLSKQPAYTQIEVFSAWEAVTPKQSITVAVLDTGVDALHEEISGIQLLNGYDAVGHVAGVHDDPDGHGTAVTGLIAAAAGNGLGTAGIAYGVRILPVRVTSGANVIYSSDLIRGIRFAADAGAQIINLSLGGYSYSVAEYDAVRYALSRGCILIAAAGNDGKGAQGSKDVYPASYEGVISVGSCAADGMRCDFSQRSERVDLLAPGEDLHLLAAGGKGAEAYKTDSGTSYSAAMVSGIAALVLSASDGNARMEGAELLSLLSDGRTREAGGVGFGPVNAMQAVRDANTPLISGVEPEMTYSGRVNIRFNRGSALLDGEEFHDGGSVFRNGSHTLVVTDGTVQKTVTFRLRYTPATYELRESEGAFTVTYTGGQATLDGFPYVSGTKIDAPGYHVFRLTDSVGDVTERTFFCDNRLPAVSGVEAGGVYDHPVWITLTGSGSALLDGEPVSGECFVTADGQHTLQISNAGNSKTLYFTLQTGKKEWENTIARCDMLVDEANGWYALCGEMLTGLRVYDLQSGAYRSFADTRAVNGYATVGEQLIVFGDGRLSVLDPTQMLGGEALLATYAVHSDAFAEWNGTVYCLSGGELQTVSLQDGSLTPVFATAASELYSDGTALWLYGEDGNRLERYDGNERTLFELPSHIVGKRKLFAPGWLFCQGNAVRLSDCTVAFQFAGYALCVSGDTVFTTGGVFRLEDGVQVGAFDRTLSAVCPTENGVYQCIRTGGVRFFPHGTGYAPMPGAAVTDPVASDPYTNFYRFYGVKQDVTVAAYKSRFSVVLPSARQLLLYRDGRLQTEVRLPFSPIGSALNETQCAAWSEEGLIWLDGIVMDAGGPVRTMWYGADGWYILANEQVLRISGNALSPTGIRAQSACGSGNVLCWLNNEQLSIRNAGQTVTVPCIASTVFTDGVYVVAGKQVYRASNGQTVTRLQGNALAVCDGCVLTESGLFAAQSGKKIASVTVPNGAEVALSDGCGVLLCTEAGLTVSGYSAPIWEDPVVSGIPENGMINEQGSIRYDRGSGFLDGKPFASGDTVKEPGEHTLSLVLPCALVRSYTFTVIPALQGISFATPVYRLAEGEKGTLRIQYAPNGTLRVPVIFSCEQDCIALEADGSFSALHDGEATVTARTEDGVFSASCKVIVTEAILRFDPALPYRVDREQALLFGVPAGTKTEELLAGVVSEGDLSCEGVYVGTGSVITLKHANGDALDSLTVVVRGDLDGDGFVTLADLLLLEEALESGFKEDLFSYAGDFADSGSVTDQDANEMQQMLLFRSGSNNPLPPTGKSGELDLFKQSIVCAGDILYVTVYLRDGKRADCTGCYGASGRFYYNEACMTYLGCELYDWTVELQTTERTLSFLAHGEAAEGTLPLFTVRFRLQEDIPDQPAKLLLRDGVVLQKNGVYSVPRKEYEVSPTQRIYGPISLQIDGMAMPFDEERTVYEVSLPAGTPGLTYQVTYPEGCELFVYHTVFDRSNTLEATFVFQLADGETKTYTVHAHRDGNRPLRTDSSLYSLTVEGFALEFDPGKTLYQLTVPYETERLTLEWETMDDKATVTVQNPTLRPGQTTNVTLTVQAEDGSQTVYTIRVFREEKPSDQPKAQTDGMPVWAWLLLASTLALIGGAAYGYFRKGSTPSEEQNETTCEDAGAEEQADPESTQETE